MRIVMDMQGAQTESRFRGIGRYTLSLAQAIVRNRGEHEVLLALNGLFPDTIEPIRASFDGLLPQDNIRVWYAPGPVRECESGNTWRREAAEHIREAFLASLQPDVMLICSLFEGYVDDAVTSVGRFDQNTPTVVALYDLIPLSTPDQYHHPFYEGYYLRKIEHLKRANAWLGISEFSAKEVEETLGLAKAAVYNISIASDPQFRKVLVSADVKQAFYQRFGLAKPFVMYSAGTDGRTNLHRLIRGYAQLAPQVRSAHQLALVGAISEVEVQTLETIAKSAGLRDNELVLTGHVSDEDLVQLYNLCKLFVFPSWHEGFGLPALDAMSCGAPVISANTSSLSELVGLDEALFDPYSEQSISAKIGHALTDDVFRARLVHHGVQQGKMFSWHESARRAIAAFERLYAERLQERQAVVLPARRPKLAYISPLPPERSGISDYSAELLPELAHHYDIEVVAAQTEVTDPWIKANCPIRSVDWFTQHANRYDRTLYHFGNSHFHHHMFGLLERFPGVAVLNDFFLSHVQAYREINDLPSHVWVRELYAAHGYATVRERFHTADITDVIFKYPCNVTVLQQAIGVIVHSAYAAGLAREWYSNELAEGWAVIPLLRVPAKQADRADARQKLGFSADDVVICSFGILNPTKQNHRLLDAWLTSALARDKRCKLVFVGENPGGDYGVQLQETIRRSGLEDRITITGWADTEVFRQYLAAADMAVQLRAQSRGETSAAILDCMNYGLPTIANANGSLADLPAETVWMLPDEFNDSQLAEALEALRQDHTVRTMLGASAREEILTRHAPRVCAKQYAEAIENFYSRARTGTKALIQAIVALGGDRPNDAEGIALAQSIAQSLPLRKPSRQLLIDVSATCRVDLKTGIERVARALITALVDSPPKGYRVEPVYLSDEGGYWHYRYARRYTLQLLNCPADSLADEVVEPQNGDLLLGVDLSGQMLIDADMSGLHARLREAGVAVYFIVYDLLPVLLPSVFPPGASNAHARWLQTIAQFDGALCISRAVADELSDWLNANGLERRRPFKIGWFHLGADVENTVPMPGLPDDALLVLRHLGARPSFLMVGTIEPRKGYLQTLEAFTQLWEEGVEVNLVIVGSEGWKGLPVEMRRTIPRTVERLFNHHQLGKRLFWLDGISDEYLEKVYAASTCLIAASEGEGFGLPLIEAAQHGIPIIAREMPVFREIAGDHAFYFQSTESGVLACAIRDWLALFESGRHPKSNALPRLTWLQSAEALKRVIFEGDWYGKFGECNSAIQLDRDIYSKREYARPEDTNQQALISGLVR